MSAFEWYAVQRLLDRAQAAGVEIPAELADTGSLFHDGMYAARTWAAEHPDDDAARGCCWGDTNDGPAKCLCWVPIFEVEQAEPVPPVCAEDVAARESMCGDCAFRPGSPERSDAWTAEALYEAAAAGTPFWCHQGMRRPARHEHPDGRTVEGSPDDWQPPIVAGIPYRADGRPGLLCAGWAAVAARHATKVAAPC